jgi:UDP-GlcNAc:undecaprenyl-phosphate GlcNAc-1-phosphate transferase
LSRGRFQRDLWVFYFSFWFRLRRRLLLRRLFAGPRDDLGSAADTDQPDGQRKLHARETPLVGGFAVLVPTFTVTLISIYVVAQPTFLGPAIAASILFLILGVLDDRFGLSALFRLASFTLAAFVLLLLEPLFVLHSLDMHFLGHPFVIVFGPAASLATLIIIVGFVSTSNMSDAMNGQLLGSVVIWSLFLSVYLADYAGPASTLPYLALALTSIVALAFKLRGQLFSGSAGSYGASLFVAASAIAAYYLSEGRMPASVPMFWFYLPVIDCLRLMVARSLQGHSPFRPDRTHFHHVLQSFLSPAAALVVYLIMLAVPGVVAFINNDLAWFAFVLCVAAYGAIFVGHSFAEANSQALKAKGAAASSERN